MCLMVFNHLKYIHCTLYIHWLARFQSFESSFIYYIIFFLRLDLYFAPFLVIIVLSYTIHYDTFLYEQ